MTHLPGIVRDEFLAALETYAYDRHVTIELRALCERVRNCTDVLPRLACADAQVAAGSSYGAAARAISTR